MRQRYHCTLVSSWLCVLILCMFIVPVRRLTRAQFYLPNGSLHCGHFTLPRVLCSLFGCGLCARLAIRILFRTAKAISRRDLPAVTRQTSNQSHRTRRSESWPLFLLPSNALKLKLFGAHYFFCFSLFRYFVSNTQVINCTCIETPKLTITTTI